MTRLLPSPEELVTLIQASLHNASGLLDDARTLLAAGSAPRAHALATLALEEIGKSHLCILGAGLVPVPDGTVYGPAGEDFWTAWMKHPVKLFWAQCQLRMVIRDAGGPVDEVAVQIAAEARADHLRKLRGFYVDFEDGTIRLPSEITAADAEELIDDAALVLKVAESAWCADGSRERALDVLSRPEELVAMTERLAQAMVADPEATFTTAREIFTDAMGEVLPPSAHGAVS